MSSAVLYIVSPIFGIRYSIFASSRVNNTVVICKGLREQKQVVDHQKARALSAPEVHWNLNDQKVS